MALFRQNIRQALRLLWRSPGFAAVTLLSLALGIGANTAIFSVLDAVVLRELPVPQPRQLAELSVIYRNGGRVPLSYPMFQELERNQRVFAGLYGWSRPWNSNIEAGGHLFLGGVRSVTGNYFSGMGAIPQLGRLIGPADAANAAPVAVLGYECWASRFGYDRAVLGAAIRIEGRPFTVVGVTRRWFTGMNPGAPADVSVPLTASSADRQNRALLWLLAAGRLRDTVSVEQARAQLRSFWPQVLDATVPTESRGQRRQSFFAMQLNVERAAAGADRSLRQRLSRPLYLLMGVVALILLIACVNLANLTLARAAARSYEINTRAALGASRGQIVRQLLTESLLLSAIGSLFALAIAHWGSPLLVRLITQGADSPVILDLRPDWRVFAFACAAAILTGALIGLVPAWQMSRQDPALVLRQRGAARSLGKSGRILIVTQIALSLILLFGGGLLLRTFANLRSVERGFRKAGVLEVSLHRRPGAPESSGINSYRRQIIERAQHLPGAISAAFSDLPVPTGNQAWKETVAPSGADVPQTTVMASLMSVSPGFFQTVGVPLLSGRDFTWNDDPNRSIAMVDSEVARRLFPAGDAIGRRIRFGVQPYFQNLEIIGVARAARLIDLHDAGQHAIFIPCTQPPQYTEEGHLLLSGSHAADLAHPLDQQVRALGREFISETRTIEQMSDETLAAEQATAIFSTAFAAAALLLAGIGLFGLISYTVTLRTREIGIRLALGSQPRAILSMIMRETLLLTAAGITLGVPCAFALSRLIASALFQLSPLDPPTLLASAAALLGVGAMAGYFPARRVLQLDPMAALRTE